MKKLNIIALLAMGAAIFTSCKPEETNKPIDIETHYDMVYMLGANAIDAEGNSHWDATSPLAMTATENPDEFVAELDMVLSAENKLIKFCLTADKPWNEADFVVPALDAMVEGKSFAYLKEGVNKLAISSELRDGVGNLRDHFFGMEKGTSGRYKLVVNPVELTLTATKLSTLEEPEILEWEEGMLYLVGDLNGWAIASPTPMVRNGNVYTYEGILKAGTMKIATVFSWNGDFYRPAIDATIIGKGGIADKGVQCHAGDPDEKWAIADTGRYSLTLDITAMTMDAKWLGEE